MVPFQCVVGGVAPGETLIVTIYVTVDKAAEEHKPSEEENVVFRSGRRVARGEGD